MLNGHVPAGARQAEFPHEYSQVSILTRSKFLSCRISLCIQPYNQLHHLEHPFANASQHIVGSQSKSTENGFYEIGHLSIPVRELGGSGQKGWFKLAGMSASYDVEVYLDLHYTPEVGESVQHNITPARVMGPQQSGGSVSEESHSSSATPDSTEFIEEEQDKTHISHDMRSRIAPLAEKKNETPSIQKPKAELREWQKEALRLKEIDKEREGEQEEGTGGVVGKAPWEDPTGGVSQADEVRNSSFSDLSYSETESVLPPTDDEEANVTKVAPNFGHENIMLLIQVDPASVLISEGMLQNIKGQLHRDLARCLCVPYHRIEMKGMQRHASAPSPNKEDARVDGESSVREEWVVSVSFLNDCLEPVRGALSSCSARELVHELLRQCRTKTAFIHAASSTNHLLAVCRSESEVLWMTGEFNDIHDPANVQHDASTGEGDGWQGLEVTVGEHELQVLDVIR